MKIVEFDINNVPEEYTNINLCLGFFDGVHLGHQKMVKAAVAEGHPVGILTFDIPPHFVTGQIPNKRCLTSIDEKADYFEELGVSFMFILAFDEVTRGILRLDFVDWVLKKFKPNKIYCGEDFRFGKDALGDPKFLKQHFNVEVTPLLSKNGMKVSSKDIREFVKNGEVNKAVALLGHPYRIVGEVKNGLHQGQKIGFPTANLDLDFPYVMPKEGVYMGYCLAFNKRYKAMISVSTHPTFSQLLKPIIEVHLIDFSGMLYGVTIYVDFVDRVRDIVKYDKPEDLVKQLTKDKEFIINNLQ